MQQRREARNIDIHVVAHRSLYSALGWNALWEGKLKVLSKTERHLRNIWERISWNRTVPWLNGRIGYVNVTTPTVLYRNSMDL